MAEEKMAPLELLRKGQEPGGDVLADGVRWLLQELLEAEVSAQIGADRYERTSEWTAQRNGYRARPWDTRLGTLEVQIPKLRTGSYFPSWLEPRRRAEQALVAVITEAHVQGVSTRKVEALVQSLGIAGISKSEVSRLCAGLDEQAHIVRTRRLDAEYPYLWLDARYEKVRGVKLVTSDAHPGLKQAIAEVFVGSAWQRCRVHLTRNAIARVAKTAQALVAATVRSIFEQPDRAAAEAQLRHVCETLAKRFPAVVQLLEGGRGRDPDVLRLPARTSPPGGFNQPTRAPQ